MTKEEILDEILLGLADTFEGGNLYGFSIEHDPTHPEEFEPLRECLADMISHGWLAQRVPFKLYNLTPAGYLHFQPRVQAFRTLGKP